MLAAAKAAGEQGDYRSAVLLLEELIAGEEAPAAAWLYLGRALHALGEYGRALAAFGDYIIQRPNAPAGSFFAGRTYLALGFPGRAVRLFERARDAGGRPEVLGFLGAAQLKAHRAGAAVETLQAAVEALPKNRRIYRAYLNALFIRGAQLCRAEDYDLGAQMLRFVLENGADAGFSPGPLLYLELGRACRETGRLEEAAEHYGKALELAGGDEGIRWARAAVFLELGQTKEARAEIAHINGAAAPPAGLTAELAEFRLIQNRMDGGRWKEAARLCRGWIRNRGASAGIHALYAEALRNLRRYPAALRHLERAVENDERPEFLEAIIHCAWEARDLPRLSAALRRLDKLGGSRRVITRFSALLASASEGDPKETLAKLQDAVRVSGPDAELVNALGRAYLALGFLDEAASWFGKTLLLNEDDEEAHLGVVAAREALFAESAKGGRANAAAARALEAAYAGYLARWDDNRAVRRDEALFLIKTCRYEQAVPRLEALLAWDSGSRGLRRLLAYACRKTGRWREAASLLRALLRESPGDLPVLLDFAYCAEKAGGAASARLILEKAQPFFPRAAEIPFALGMIAVRAGETERAFDSLREASARAPKESRALRAMAVLARKNGDETGAARYERAVRERETAGLK
jgi:tetratricopeptide (TPR) repeat protein